MTTHTWKEEKLIPLCNNEKEEGSNYESVTLEWLGAVLDDGYEVVTLISVEIHPPSTVH